MGKKHPFKKRPNLKNLPCWLTPNQSQRLKMDKKKNHPSKQTTQ